MTDCVRCYTKDWLHVSRQYLHHSTSVPGRNQLTAERLANLQSCPQPEFEVDLEDDRGHDDVERVSRLYPLPSQISIALEIRSTLSQYSSCSHTIRDLFYDLIG